MIVAATGRIDTVQAAEPYLKIFHYLGPAKRGFSVIFPDGVLVFSNPNSRRLPNGAWLELTRWCIFGGIKNAGSKQWAAAVKLLHTSCPGLTTIVSYSDPNAGHTGALYRACNWRWAPTWHRLRPPPSGNGSWADDRGQGVKDRWIFPIRPDPSRVELLAVNDSALKKRMPWAEYREPLKGPGGGDYARFKREVLAPGVAQ